MIAPDLVTDRLLLSVLVPSDASERYRGWMTDPEIIRYLESRGADQTLASLESYIAAMSASDDSCLFGIFTPARAEHIGNIKLGPISVMHSSASVGLIIGERSWWGRGIATEVVAAVSRWAFDDVGLQRLYAGAYAENVASVKAFQRVGYRIEGVRRSAVRLPDGRRDDLVELGLLPDDPGFA